MATYEGLASKGGKVREVLREQEFMHMDHMNDLTSKALIDEHLANMEANIRNGLWDKHGPMSFGLHGLGDNKAVIGIGAGPSYNLNSNVLRQVSDFNTMKHVDDQPFIFICSNHQWKPCMKQGIYPHFISIVDAGDVLFDHLCTDIPPEAQNTILLTGLHCSPRVLKEWDRQGRPILFYVPNFEKKRELFQEISKEDPSKFTCEEGGNVLNMSWIISRKFMGSSVFIAVGNDNCFPVDYDPQRRRDAFYADGDYSPNIKNKRDEARHKMAWMGFEIEFNPIIQKDIINLRPFFTSYQLWVYKKWIESQVAMCDAELPKSFHYYNCSESGILGVIAKDTNTANFMDKNNWMLMDHLLPKKWHTVRLRTAISQFLRARDLWADQEEIHADASLVVH